MWWLAVVVVVPGVYLAGKIVHRLVFHPLAAFPGPTLAAASIYYKAYFDVVKHGGLLAHIKDLHEQYGPVVRIAPNELHFADPRAFADIYAINSKFTKDPAFYNCFGQEQASFGLINPHESRVRRDMLHPLFSRRAVLKLENVVQENVDKLISRLSHYEPTHTPANLFMAFRSCTLDIISSYCLATTFHALDHPHFLHPFLTGLQSLIPFFWVLKYVPVLVRLVREPPAWAQKWLRDPASRAFFECRTQAANQIDTFLADPTALDNASHEIVYHHLLAPSASQLGLKSTAKAAPIPRSGLLQEALTLLFGGSDTLGNTLTVGTFRVLNDPRVYRTLVEELVEAWPNKEAVAPLATLEKLPYLTAVVKESLRVTSGVVTPLPRIVGPGDARIGEWGVPKGTTVSMSSIFMHFNADLFPDPHAFRPERWLISDELEGQARKEREREVKDLEGSLVAFSRGPRGCVGINLAYCELHLIIGNLFRKLDMEIFNTTVDDFKFNDNFVPVYQGNAFHAYIKERTT